MTEEINKAISVLDKGGLILYPTDTVWGIGCDATNEEAVDKVYALKQRTDSKALICLVANDAMLERHVAKVPDVAYDIMDLSLAYSFGRFKIESGINNLLDNSYFTRRATGYPGPGILPSQPRTWYTALQIKI